MTLRWPLLFLLALPCAAQDDSWTTENAADFSWKAVEDDARGFYLLWPRQEEGSTRILGQHFLPGGDPLWDMPGQSLMPVLTGTAAWTAFSDSQHGLAVAWVEQGRVWVQRIGPDGQPLSHAPQ